MNGWEMLLESLEYYPNRPMSAMCHDMMMIISQPFTLYSGVIIYR